MVTYAETALEKDPPAAEDLAHQEISEDNDDDETCGFCIFMKAGGCKDEFKAWSKCVDDERQDGKDFTEECKDRTEELQKCMISNKEYYAPVLEEGDSFADTKEKFDTATTSESPQDLDGESDSQEGEKDSAAEPAADDESDGKSDAESEEEEADEEEEQPAHDISVKTTGYDARFPSYNQARNCYTRYNEYHRCIGVDEKGEDDPECKLYQRAYRSICPMEWVNSWNEQRDAGTWPGKY